MIHPHSDVLPGRDEGALDLDASVEMARSMTTDGVTVVCGAAHVREDRPTSVEAMEEVLRLAAGGGGGLSATPERNRRGPIRVCVCASACSHDNGVMQPTPAEGGARP